MTHLRQHDPQATLPAEPPWMARVAAMSDAFRWARIIGAQLIVAMVSGDEEKAVRLARVAGGMAIEGLGLSSEGWLCDAEHS